jgi:signal transduction histidine kinase
MRLIAWVKRVAKRHWPALSIRTILLATFVFVAALPGVGAVGLRVYENTLVQQTEAELIAQGAVLAAAYRAAWDGGSGTYPLAPEPPTIDLRTDPVLAPLPDPVPGGPPDPAAARIGRALAPVATGAAAVTLASTRLLDRRGVVVTGRGDLGMSYADVAEVRRALRGHPATTLRARQDDNPYGMRSPLEWLSRAVAIRVHHARPVVVGGRVVGVVLLSRSPRGLFVGIYQDRGKIAAGAVAIFVTLLFLAGLLSRGIARPIRDLTRATEQVAGGAVVFPDPPATAAIEIRDLYANFGAMAARIDARARYLRDFAAAVSHEFKTPLTGIRGVLELLGEHEMTPAERDRFLRNAAVDADRLALLVHRLLELARADMAVARIGRCRLSEVVAMLDADAFPLTATGDADVPLDPETLATVLRILADNSRQAGATAAAVTPVGDDAQLTLHYVDDGPGVPVRDRERIFEPFFTSRRTSGGTGLGLPIARSLLDAQGARLLLDPDDGSARGAAFRLILRRHDG